MNKSFLVNLIFFPNKQQFVIQSITIRSCDEFKLGSVACVKLVSSDKTLYTFIIIYKLINITLLYRVYYIIITYKVCRYKYYKKVLLVV